MARQFGVRAALLLAAGLVFGCGSKPVVGVLLPTTGSASAYGESIESGIRLALAESRASGTLPAGLEIVWADTASDPATAVAALRGLVNDRGAGLVIGGATSSEAIALLPVIDELDVVLLSPSASAPQLTRESKLFYRMYPSDELEASAVAGFIARKLGAHTVLTFVRDGDYARGIEPEFLEQYQSDAVEGRVVGRIALDEPDWRETAQRMLRAEKPAAVFVIAYAEDTLEVLRHLREIGFEGRILTTSAFDSTRVIQQAGSLADGVMFPLPPFDRTSEKALVAGFVKSYLETYQRPPDVQAAHGYDAMRLVFEVVRIARPFVTPEINKALHFGVQELLGVTGPIQFDDRGDIRHNPIMFICEGGQVFSYESYLDRKRKEILRRMQDLLIPKG